MKYIDIERNNYKGITLIALVITIIVLLILAGITINALTGSDSAPAKANEAEQKNDIGTAMDEIGIIVINAKTNAYETAYVGSGIASEEASKVVGQQVITAALGKNNSNKGKASIEVIQTSKGGKLGDAKITIATRDFKVQGKITIEDGILTWGEIKDNIPEKKGIPEVGDFVNFDAGVWTRDDFKKLGVTFKKNSNNEETDEIMSYGSVYGGVSYEFYNHDYSFGTFSIGDRKNEGSKELIAYDVYETDTNNKYLNYLNGWRVFDITDDEDIILISAGSPECYRHPYGDNNGYKSEFILTGKINSNATTIANDFGLGTTYKARNWNDSYVSAENYSKGIRANLLSKKELLDWYKKFVDNDATSLDSTTFQKIYKYNSNCVNNGKYESLIDNGTYYWLGTADGNNAIALNFLHPHWKSVEHSGIYTYNYGVRILIKLPSTITLKENPSGKKNVTSRDSQYQYNVWDINE